MLVSRQSKPLCNFLWFAIFLCGQDQAKTANHHSPPFSSGRPSIQSLGTVITGKWSIHLNRKASVDEELFGCRRKDPPSAFSSLRTPESHFFPNLVQKLPNYVTECQRSSGTTNRKALQDYCVRERLATVAQIVVAVGERARTGAAAAAAVGGGAGAALPPGRVLGAEPRAAIAVTGEAFSEGRQRCW
ncbi:hypothetical protein MPTK1_8g16990 [Marchantia polymorpha subsp. ruderalis]|uniref:BURP domain-containing protein n=1 Tax=Marchantia polymorpha TaxID=3197 RepID=A0A2R6X852_MARPO|nr:hypothetical protein MARPO_0030s0032 [Marchantia polymorpha]BBN20170.1 hypothetical protein Mp_8g16990 [Marchantia polymorpha subsp. ruderalis]|eukprot:PTQ42286.1 hypothetical protein MARPO_0030s0032 [Marchantia polymorpha]